MISAGVFDIAAIAARRHQLFGAPERWAPGLDRERYGTGVRHCGICPKAEDEYCVLSCETQRQALNDGVTVS